MDYKVKKSEEEWRAQLSDMEYAVLREAGTERPFTGKYDSFEEEGIYSCNGCGVDLFESTHKFHSGCGWPSFWGELDSASIEKKSDESHGMKRVELLCSNCGGHLGHIFNDGPPPTGQRYCINSVSLNFRSKDSVKVHTIDLHFQGAEKSIAAYLVETADGPIVIEVGPHSTLPYLKKGIEAAGFKFEDIKHVFLTHIHLDHAGSAWCFADHGAKIYVHPRGAKHLADPSRLMNSAKRIYQDQMDVLWGEMREITSEQIVEVEHETVIEIGGQKIKALHTPGHAVHHIAWQIGDIAFTGDVAGVKIEQGPVIPPCPPPDIHIGDWKASIELLRNANIKHFYLGHFGMVTDIENHLNSLSARLDEYANWMKEKMDEGIEYEPLVPLFQEFVEDSLRREGLSEEDLLAYSKANPAWMSVAGLMRYWTKHGGTVFGSS